MGDWLDLDRLRDFWWIGAVAVGMIAMGVFFVRQGVRFLRAKQPQGWLPASARVVDWEAKSGWGGRGILGHFPVFEYPLPDGTLHRVTNPTTFDLGVYPTGQSEPILIDPRNPRRAQMVSTVRTGHTMGGLFIVLGAFVGLMGVAAFAVFTIIVTWS